MNPREEIQKIDRDKSKYKTVIIALCAAGLSYLLGMFVVSYTTPKSSTVQFIQVDEKGVPSIVAPIPSIIHPQSFVN